MLASYTTLKSSPCVKCKRLIDPSAQFPTVRTRLRTMTTDSQHVYMWQAFHKGCIWKVLSVGIAAITLTRQSKERNQRKAYVPMLSWLLYTATHHYLDASFSTSLDVFGRRGGCAGYVYYRRWGLLTAWCQTSILDDCSERFAIGSFPRGTRGTNSKKEKSRIRHEHFLSQSFRTKSFERQLSRLDQERIRSEILC